MNNKTVVKQGDRLDELVNVMYKQAKLDTSNRGVRTAIEGFETQYGGYILKKWFNKQNNYPTVLSLQTKGGLPVGRSRLYDYMRTKAPKDKKRKITKVPIDLWKIIEEKFPSILKEEIEVFKEYLTVILTETEVVKLEKFYLDNIKDGEIFLYMSRINDKIRHGYFYKDYDTKRYERFKKKEKKMKQNQQKVIEYIKKYSDKKGNFYEQLVKHNIFEIAGDIKGATTEDFVNNLMDRLERWKWDMESYNEY